MSHFTAHWHCELSFDPSTRKYKHQNRLEQSQSFLLIPRTKIAINQPSLGKLILIISSNILNIFLNYAYYNQLQQYLTIMSILQGIRAHNLKTQRPRFIIKPRISSKQNKQQHGYEPVNVTDQEVHLFIEYMISKSQRLRQVIEKKQITDEDIFFEKHLFKSTCLKTMIKHILDRMMSERRLGKNLKGMNKSNLVEIQNLIWSVVEREVSLYLNELEYTNHSQQLRADLNQRRFALQKQIQKLNRKRQKTESDASRESLDEVVELF